MVWFAMEVSHLLTSTLRNYRPNDKHCFEGGRYVTKFLAALVKRYAVNNSPRHHLSLWFEMKKAKKNPMYNDVLYDTYVLYKVKARCDLATKYVKSQFKSTAYSDRDSCVHSWASVDSYWSHTNVLLIEHILTGTLWKIAVLHSVLFTESIYHLRKISEGDTDLLRYSVSSTHTIPHRELKFLLLHCTTNDINAIIYYMRDIDTTNMRVNRMIIENFLAKQNRLGDLHSSLRKQPNSI